MSRSSWLVVAAVLAILAMHEMTVLSLCLAVLATAAVLLLRAARPRSGLLAVLPPAVTTATRPLVVRLHAPPDLHALSVLRW